MNTFIELSMLPDKQLVPKLMRFSSMEIMELITESDKLCDYYSEQADKYCSSISEKMICVGGKLVPKYKKSEIMSTEQFMSLLGKMKRRERLASFLLQQLGMTQALEDDPDLRAIYGKALVDAEKNRLKLEQLKDHFENCSCWD